MQNSQLWVPTKYEYKNGQLKASRNTNFLTVSSRLMTDITAKFYQRYVPLHVRGRLVDLGCGNVPFYQLYKPLVTENICVDWPNSAHTNSYLDVECDLNQPLPFPNNSFDTILISEVLEHVANPELAWSEMARILKTGGKIVLSVPFFYKIHEAPHDYYRYTEFALTHLASKNKLQTLELKSFGGLPEIFADIMAKNLTRIPIIGRTCSIFAQWICRIFLRTRIGKKISTVTGRTFPLGYFMIAVKS